MTLSQRQELEFGGRSVKLRTQLAYVPTYVERCHNFFQSLDYSGINVSFFTSAVQPMFKHAKRY